MSIFIYEDDIIQAQSMKRMIEDICDSQQISYDFIKVTSNKERIIESIPLTTRIPIYFLDIEIKDDTQKGLHVAQDIRTYDDQGLIVFVTTHAHLAPISYQYMVSALTFIDKGLDYDERYDMIEQSLLYYEKRNKQQAPADDFVIDNTKATVRVPFRTVQYIMTARPHRLELVTEERVIQFYGALKEVEKIDERLLRCHQSYVVNREHISSYHPSEKELALKSGKRIPVSRRLGRQVRQVIKRA